MAGLYSSSVTVSQVGSYFVQQYYQVLQKQPEFAHQFYTGSSTLIRIDGESTETASAMRQIHSLVQSLQFSAIEIKTINSVESWCEGIVVTVSGSVKSKRFNGWRKFIQTFFLAPQEKGYFVRNDIFHFVSDEVTNHLSLPLATVHKDDFHFQPVDINSLHLGSKDQGDYFTSQERQNQQQEDKYDREEESPVEQSSFDRVDYFLETCYQNNVALHQNTSAYVHEPIKAVQKLAFKPVKFTYASIVYVFLLCLLGFGFLFACCFKVCFKLQSNGKSTTSVSNQAPAVKSVSPTNECHQPPEQAASFVPETTNHVTEDTFANDEGEFMSVYVRNLPTSITSLEIYQEFKNFGRIKQDGVFLKHRKDVGICFAFVEFEDYTGVLNAIEASPIQLAGKEVYIEERRANSSSSSFRGGRGRDGMRGRGSYDASRGRYGGVSNGRGNIFHNY